MVKVHMSGEKWLQREIRPRLLAEAAIRIGAMLGIRGTVELEISPHFSKCRGQAFVNGAARITLYPKFIEKNAKERGWSLPFLYSCTLAHELGHVAQAMRGSVGLKDKTCEAEALALEDVFGPEAERILRRGA